MFFVIKIAAITAIVLGVIGIAYILLEGWLHNRRLSRMRKQTDEARQREKRLKRPVFLP